MAIALKNTTTTDAYQDFAGSDVLASGWFTIANNPVLVKIVHGIRGQAIEGPEMFLPPGTYPMRSGGRPDPIAGIRFKSALTGTPAQVFGTFFYPGEATLEGGSPFTATVSASGAISGGGAGSMQLISDQVLVGAVVSVAFTNIPQTFAHLLLIWDALTDNAAPQQIQIRLNGDAGANYDYELLQGVGAVASAAAATAQTGIVVAVAASTTDANGRSAGDIEIPNYVGSTFRKSVLFRSGQHGATSRRLSGSGQWRSPAAITRIDLPLDAGNYPIGSRFSLYGIAI